MLATDLFLACSQALSPVWVCFTSLQSVTGWIIDIKGHRKCTEDHCRLFTGRAMAQDHVSHVSFLALLMRRREVTCVAN